MLDLGTVKPGSTIRIPFSTFDKDDGSSITMTSFAAADILAYKDGGTTERASTAGYTATTDFDGKTGKHIIVIDLADNTTAGFWNAGSEYLIAIDAVTVDAVTVGGWVARFRIGYDGSLLDTTIATLASQTSFTLTVGPAEDDALNGRLVIIHNIASAVQLGQAIILDYTGSTKTVTLAAGTTFTAAAGDNISIMGLAPLQPTTAGRTLDVSAGGEAGLDWANVGSPTTTLNLSGTTVGTAAAVTTVNGLAANVITATSIASDAITDAKVASDVTIASVTGAVGSVSGAVGSVTGNVGGNVVGTVASVVGAVGSVTGNVGGNVTGSVGSIATGGITTASFAAGAIDAAAIAANAIGASELAADAVAEIQSGLATATAVSTLQTDVTTLTGYVDTEVAAIKAKTDNLPSDPADASDIAAAFSTVNSTLATIAAYIDTEVAAIKAKTDNLPADPADASDIAASFSSIASTLSTIAAYIDTEVAAIKAKTDSLTFTVAGKVDSNILAIAGSTTAATNQSKAALAIYPGTVTTTGTTTTLIDTGLTQVDDHWIGRVVIFLTGTLAYQATTISDFTASTDTLTLVALTSAPQAGDTYLIV